MKTFVLAIQIASGIFLTSPAIGQIVPDRTLPTATSVISSGSSAVLGGGGRLFEIDGGHGGWGELIPQLHPVYRPHRGNGFLQQRQQYY